MNCEKIKTDFNKRFGSECESIYFAGKPITFLKGKGKMLGCGVSVGCYLAIEKRDDDRLMVQFSDSDRFLTVNTNELEIARDNEIFTLLSEVKQLGVKVGGARLFFYTNSALYTPKKTILLSALGAFCRNVPDGTNILRHFEHYDSAMTERCGKENYLFLYDGAGGRYLPLPKERYKIVLCHVEDKKIKEYALTESRIDTAIEALEKGDFSAFGKILNSETERLIKKNSGKATKNLFKTAVELGESLGNGVLDEGGIFSIVENKNVDSFVRNISLEYRRYFGKDPDFYVTDTGACAKVY